MKRISFVRFLIMLFFHPFFAKAALEHELLAKRGTPQFVYCSNADRAVLSSDLSKIIFWARPGESLKTFQDWQSGYLSQKRDNEKTYLRVEFMERDEAKKKVGWVRKEYVRLEADCPLFKYGYHRDLERQVGPYFDLYDPDCCNFPTNKRPTTSYLEGMRRFGAGRSGGSRLHAACDLYRTKDEPVYSVGPGTVQLGLYEFYMGTYAIEVKHEGGFVVRYGEVTGKRAPNISTGKKVSKGQHVGYMAQIRMSNCCEPMLHFELYSGKASGSLSGGGAYRRRSDLMNPSSFLRQWEKAKFGESY